MAQNVLPKMTAFVACNGGCRNHGCTWGCIGCGLCTQVCPSGAISVSPDGVAFVDREKCTGCGMCEAACPQGIVSLHDAANAVAVRCSNHDRGAEARKQCDVSCAACGLCEKICTARAIRVVDNCAVIDDRYCLSCGMCAVRCARKAIVDHRGIFG